MEELTQEKFRELLNTTFSVAKPDGAALEFELTDVADLGSTPRQKQFSIIFKGPLEPQLAQGTYGFEHGSIGKFALFIVPIRKNNEAVFYESIFNRFVEDKPS